MSSSSSDRLRFPDPNAIAVQRLEKRKDRRREGRSAGAEEMDGLT
jgi:hypothetical protein